MEIPFEQRFYITILPVPGAKKTLFEFQYGTTAKMVNTVEKYWYTYFSGDLGIVWFLSVLASPVIIILLIYGVCKLI